MKEMTDAPEFTDEQLRDALRCVGRDARQAAFAAGLAVVYIKDRSIVELHPDGSEVIVGSLSEGADGGTNE